MADRLPPLTEKEFQRQVVELATIRGWRVYHPFLSKWSERGFPDLTMVRARDRRLVFAELKRDKGRTSEAQDEWLALLGRLTDESCGVPPGEVRDGRRLDVYLWRPADWPEIEEALR